MSNIEQKAADYANAKFNPEKHLENVPNFYCIDLYEAFLAGYRVLQKEYEDKHRWIPVEEKLPPLNQEVLFKYSEGEYCIGCLNVYGYYCSPYNPTENDHASIHLLSEVTHWRAFL